MPWQTKDGDARENFKYEYYPHGDPRNPAREAPSALNTVIIPNVTLPKVSEFSSNELHMLMWIVTARQIQQMGQG